MKLHSLVLQGVGPFRGREEIDFDRLSESSLFLIDGPTGSGKSTIIDCITYALFNTMAGSTSISDSDRMRSDACGPDEDSFVELVFSVDGRRYAVRRSPEYQVTKKRGAGTTTKAATVSMLITDSDDSQLVAPTRSAEIIGRIEADLGMTAGQFRRLVVLPQGEFAELLTANSSDRQRDLEPLIADPLYRAMQAELKVRADAAREQRSEADRQVASAATMVVADLDLLDGEVRAGIEESCFADESADDQVRLSAMEAAIAHVESIRERLQGEVDESARVFATASDRAKRAEDVARVARGLVDARARVLELEADLDPGDVDLRGSDLDAAIDSANRARGRLADLVLWESGESRRAEVSAQRNEELAALEAESRSLADAESGHSGRREAAEGLLQETRLEAASLSDRTAKAAEARARRDAAHERDRLVEELVRAESRLADALDADNVAKHRIGEAAEAVLGMRRQQIAQAAARLAQGLISGKPCDVCGSTDHPSPAQPIAGEALVTDSDVEAAEREVVEREADQRVTAEAVTAATADVETVKLGLATARGVLGTQVETGAEVLSEAYADAQRAAAAATSAEAALADLELDLRAMDEAAAARHERMGQIATRIAEVTTEARAAADNVAEYRGRVVSEVGPDTTATLRDGELEARGAALSSVRTARQALAALAAEHPEASDIDLNEAVTHAARCRNDADVAAALSTDLSRAEGSLRNARDQLRLHVASFADALDRSAGVRASTRTAIRLGDSAAGRAGNRRSIDLTTYALQLKFADVLAAGSRRLSEMSSGRYSFLLNEEKSRGLAGLGISVVDARTGTGRDPKTMSGGEKFYASLSLALGLAEVVQAEVGGARLEMLFVDEGFGSLDPETLSVVIEQLEKLQDTGRTVGVISHVAEMKAAIVDEIEVVANGNGTSRIVAPGEL